MIIDKIKTKGENMSILEGMERLQYIIDEANDVNTKISSIFTSLSNHKKLTELFKMVGEQLPCHLFLFARIKVTYCC